jgi:AcrR family transcriptional regulator
VFVKRGYAGARVEDVAAEAGVAVPTVYKIFTNKRNLLMAALHAAMTGSDEGSVDEQAWWREQLDEPDPRRQLQLIARNARRIYERSGAILEVVRDAARDDAELAAVWNEVTEQRRSRSRRTAQRLRPKLGDARSPTVAELSFTLWALTAPDLYASNVRAGRSPARYEAWLADLLEAAILYEGQHPASRRRS